MVWGAIEGGKAGMENKAGEINNLHPLMLLPDNLSSTSDSIYNEMTGKNVPIVHPQYQPLGHLLLGKCKTVAQVRHLFADYFRRHFDQHLYAHLATFASIEDTRLFL